MDTLKLIQVFTVASSLAAQVKRANADKKIIKEELAAIVAEGVIPLLAIFGVNLSIDSLGVKPTERSTDVLAQVQAISDVAASIFK